MRKKKRLIAMLLSLTLVFTAQVPVAFAEGEYKASYAYQPSGLPSEVTATLPEDTNTYSDGDTVKAKDPSGKKVTANDAVYSFDGWDEDEKTVNGADVTFTGTWTKKDIVHTLEGTVYQYAYGSSESSGTAKSNVDIEITLNDGSSVSVTTDSAGKFSYVLESSSKRTSDGKYGWKIESSDEYYSASGTITEGTTDDPEENKLYIRERYVPKDSDYSFAESEDVKTVNGETWVKAAGTYKIVPASGKKLASVLDGVASDSIDISVADDGSLDSFYVYTGDLCSKILSGEKVKVDSGEPVVGSVSTLAATGTTYVREHGIYSKEKAELIMTANITEDAGIKEVYLISYKNDEESDRYDAVKVSGTDNQYKVSIGLPDEDTIMNARLVKLVAVDIFGNKSKEILIAKTEKGSSVTLEKIAPKITKSESGNKSSYGWYSELPTLTARAADDLSGLASLKISGEGKEIAEDEYDEKINAEQTISGKAKFDEASDSGSYTYTVEATDNSGNTATDTFNVKIDLVAPEISADGVKSGEFYSYNPDIQISEKEKYYKAKGNRIFVKVTRDGSSVLDTVYEQEKEVSIPRSTFGKDGVYNVKIYAKDAADNESETLTYKFTKDATAPKVSISGVKEGRFYNKRQTVEVTVKEHNYSTDNVSVSVVKKLNGSKSMGFPWKNKGETSVNSKTYSETGTYTVTAQAVDKAGNKGGPKKVSFTIDTKAPVIEITGVKDGGIYLYGQSLNPGAKVTDDYLASKSISFTRGGEPVANPSWDQIKENDGLYTMTVRAADKAGNTATKTVSFTVNRFGSYFEYNNAIKALMGKAVQNVEKDLVVREKNVSKVTDSDARIYKDGKASSAKGKTSANESGAEKVYTHTFNKADFEEEGVYEINVISRDEVGNEMESKEENGVVKFYVDRTEPTITASGIDPKGNKAESIDVDLKITDLLTGVADVDITVDGDHPSVRHEEGSDEYSFTVGEGMRQEIKVTATDNAGNTATYAETASVSSNAASLFLDRFWIPLAGVGGAGIIGLLIFLLARRKKNEDE